MSEVSTLQIGGLIGRWIQHVRPVFLKLQAADLRWQAS